MQVLLDLQGDYWVGLNDQEVEGEYVWEHSGAPLEFSAWGELFHTFILNSPFSPLSI